MSRYSTVARLLWQATAARLDSPPPRPVDWERVATRRRADVWGAGRQERWFGYDADGIVSRDAVITFYDRGDLDGRGIHVWPDGRLARWTADGRWKPTPTVTEVSVVPPPPEPAEEAAPAPGR